jgi:predicted site-specific integrase-resolvase
MYVTSRKAAQLTDLHPHTLRKYANEGKIEHIKTPSGQRRYNVAGFLQQVPPCTTICYSRVSTVNQKQQLDTQRRCLAKLYPGAEQISDIGSRLNFKRKGFNSILDRCLQGESITIVCTYRDRISHFGFDLIEKLVTRTGGKILVLNKLETSPISELTQDLLSIITCFSARIHGLRSHKNKKILTEAIREAEVSTKTVDGGLQVGLQPHCDGEREGVSGEEEIY